MIYPQSGVWKQLRCAVDEIASGEQMRASGAEVSSEG